jgi:ubiquinone/menaquinone biosynthesis C-methylase UbiE
MRWIAKSAREVFARATQYDRDNPLLSIERPEMEAMLPELAGRDVLDLGAGHAHYARLARARGARRVVALDVSPAMLRGVPVPAIVGDAAALPMASASADVVVAALVLSYVDRIRTLVEIARVLRPGGMLLISELHARGVAQGGWRRTFRGATGRTLAVEAPPPDPRVLAGELDAAGFRLEAFRETPVDQRLEPHFRRAGRRDLPALLGLPLLVHLAARKGDDA